MSTTIDLTGQKFGSITVLHRDPVKPLKRCATRWIVRCDCGNEYSTAGDNLRNKGVTQCRQCADNFIDLVGQIINGYEIIKRAPDHVTLRGRHCTRWTVKCQCSRVFNVMATHLRSGASSKCRACNTQTQKLNGKMSYRAFQKMARGARLRGLEVTIDKPYLEDLFAESDGICPYSGVPIGFANTVVESKRGGDTASVDRVDSSKGYIKGNVQWVHKTINIMKSRMTDYEFIEWCTRVAQHRKGTNESMVDRRLDPTDDIDTTTESEAA